MEAFFTILVLILSVILHEVSHGYVAEWLGDPTARLQGRLTLNPISHADPIGSVFLPALLVLTNSPFLFGWAKPVPYNPYNLRNQRWGEALVAGAGPATNLLIALIFGLLIRFGGEVFSPEFIALAAVVTYINILLAIFNMIPIPPLDGSKVLMSLIPYHLQGPFRQFENMMAGAGFFGLVLFLFVFIYVFSKPFILAIGYVFVLITGMSL
jgi:Zn-dependent protease